MIRGIILFLLLWVAVFAFFLGWRTWTKRKAINLLKIFGLSSITTISVSLIVLLIVAVF